MALEQHNTAFEFETMLRSHLSRGGSVVDACAGFDADTASAYLEDALGQPARLHYDTHLAGCPSCRRSVIELSRLIEMEPQIAPVAAPATGWLNWKSLVAGWFGLSGKGPAGWNPAEWKLAARHWGLATVGAAGAVLLTVLATQLWWQSSPQQQVAVAVPASGEQVSAGLAASPTPGDATAINSSEAQAQSQASALVTVPAPPQVGPAPGQQDLPTAVSDNLNADANRSLGPVAQGALPQDGLNAPPLPPQAPSPKVQPVIIANFSTPSVAQLGNAFTPLVESEPIPAKPDSVAREESARIIAPINPSPNDNPMKRDKKTAPTRNVFDGGLAFVQRKETPERKLETKDIEPDAPKVLTVRIRDKVFSFQGGMWVDHAYKPDMAWRITKLTQDSDDYKKVLAEEPQLKDFFERGAVIVVWKDKIYKTTGK